MPEVTVHFDGVAKRTVVRYIIRMKESRNDPTDRLICATLLAALMLAAFGFAIQPFLPTGDLERACGLMVGWLVELAAPEPDESLRYMLLCVAGVPAAVFGWKLAGRSSLRIPEAAYLAVIPLVWRTGWTGEPAWAILPGGLALAALAAKYLAPRERPSHSSRAVWIALAIAAVLTAARRFPACADLEHPFGDHVNIVLYALNAAAHGLADTHLYGFYPAFLAPVFRTVGLSRLSAELVMNLLYLAAFGLVADAARRLLRHELPLAGFLALALFTCGNFTYFLPGDPMLSDPYFACWPVRFLGPALALNLVSRKPGRLTPIWEGVLAAGALWFNPDTGIAVAGAFFAVRLFSGQFRALGLGTAVFLAAVPGWAGLLRLVNGFTPDYMGYFAYMRDFWQAGYMMTPICRPAIWLFPALILLASLVWSLRRFPVRRADAPVLFLAVLGAGMFNYYIGRSLIGNLIACAWPELLLLAIFADRAGKRRFCLRWAVLFPGCAAALLLVLRVPQIARDLGRTYRTLRDPSVCGKKLEGIRRLAGKNREVLILPKNQQGFYYAESGFKPPIGNFSMSELLFEKDEKRIMDAILNSSAPFIFTKDRHPGPAFVPYCELVARDPETGVRLYRVVNRRAGPVRRPTTPQ